jgi:hypothetical protein
MYVRRAIAQAVSRRLPTAAARVRGQVMWDLWWTEWHRGRFSPSTLVSPANSHSTDCSTINIYHLGLVQWAKQWPQYQVDSVSPHPMKLKKNLCMYVLPLMLTSPLGQQSFTGPMVPIAYLIATVPTLSTLRIVSFPVRFIPTMKREAGSSSETLVPT